MSKQREIPQPPIVDSFVIDSQNSDQKDTDYFVSINDRTCVGLPGCATGPGECR